MDTKRIKKLENIVAELNTNEIPPYPSLELFFSDDPQAKEKCDQMIKDRERWMYRHPNYKEPKLEDFIK